MALKKVFRVTLHVDTSMLHDVMTMRGIEIIDVQPVKHGGEDENGQLKSAPTAADFILAWAKAHPQFKVKDLNAEGARFGITNGAISQALHKLLKGKAIKRVGPATYARVATKTPKGKRGTVPDTVIAVIKQKQNGSGEGVPLSAIREGLHAAKVDTRNFARTLANLVKRRQLKQTAPRHYRVEV